MGVETVIGSIKKFIGSSELEKSYGKILIRAYTGRYVNARIEADCGNEEFFYFKGNVIFYNLPVKAILKSCNDLKGKRYYKIVELKNLDNGKKKNMER